MADLARRIFNWPSITPVFIRLQITPFAGCAHAVSVVGAASGVASATFLGAASFLGPWNLGLLSILARAGATTAKPPVLLSSSFVCLILVVYLTFLSPRV